jgi:hypothetical protein
MSCSDIVGVYNILGLQGKYLFSLISPIYLSRIIIDGDQRLKESVEKGINLQKRLHQLLSRPEDLIHRQIFNIIINGK